MEDDDKYDIIPASKRPDGTWRKEVRVRKGYVPPDEVKKFETKGSRFRDNQVPGFVPGMDPDDMPGKKDAKSKSQRKKKKKEEGGADGGDDDDEGVKEASAAVAAVSVSAKPAAAAESTDPKEVLAKKIRNLKKKVRQTDELQEKVSSKEVEPNEEQKEKLAKRDEIEAEIKLLEKELAAM